jgi:hypothetical protein
MEQEITPAQALDLINQVRLSYNGTGKDHDLLRKALLVIAKALESKEES